MPGSSQSCLMASAWSLGSAQTLSTSTSLISWAFSYSKEREPFIRQRKGSQPIGDKTCPGSWIRDDLARSWDVVSGPLSCSHVEWRRCVCVAQWREPLNPTPVAFGPSSTQGPVSPAFNTQPWLEKHWNDHHSTKKLFFLVNTLSFESLHS